MISSSHQYSPTRRGILRFSTVLFQTGLPAPLFSNHCENLRRSSVRIEYRPSDAALALLRRCLACSILASSFFRFSWNILGGIHFLGLNIRTVTSGHSAYTWIRGTNVPRVRTRLNSTSTISRNMVQITFVVILKENYKYKDYDQTMSYYKPSRKLLRSFLQYILNI